MFRGSLTLLCFALAAGAHSSTLDEPQCAAADGTVTGCSSASATAYMQLKEQRQGRSRSPSEDVYLTVKNYMTPGSSSHHKEKKAHKGPRSQRNEQQVFESSLQSLKDLSAEGDSLKRPDAAQADDGEAERQAANLQEESPASTHKEAPSATGITDFLSGDQAASAETPTISTAEPTTTSTTTEEPTTTTSSSTTTEEPTTTTTTEEPTTTTEEPTTTTTTEEPTTTSTTEAETTTEILVGALDESAQSGGLAESLGKLFR